MTSQNDSFSRSLPLANMDIRRPGARRPWGRAIAPRGSSSNRQGQRIHLLIDQSRAPRELPCKSLSLKPVGHQPSRPTATRIPDPPPPGGQAGTSMSDLCSGNWDEYTPLPGAVSTPTTRIAVRQDHGPCNPRSAHLLREIRNLDEFFCEISRILNVGLFLLSTAQPNQNISVGNTGPRATGLQP